LVDTNIENNFWPRRPVKSKVQLHKDEKSINPMKELLKKENDKKKDAKE
jgi:hypothetical protein